MASEEYVRLLEESRQYWLEEWIAQVAINQSYMSLLDIYEKLADDLVRENYDLEKKLIHERRARNIAACAACALTLIAIYLLMIVP